MGETILFSSGNNIGSAPIYIVLWYQSDDGKNWDSNPIDTILLSDLALSSGRYTWASQLADPRRFHKIVTESQDGTINPFGFILPPRQTPITATGFYGQKFDDGKTLSSSSVYDIGDTIDFGLRIDISDTTIIGDTISVEIKDIFGNVITTLIADLINDMYVASWDVPLSLHKSYNSQAVTDTSPDLSLYFLTDNWIFPDGVMQFPFTVKRNQEDPVRDNCTYEISLGNIETTTHGALSNYTFRFTSTLIPYYCSVQDVVDVHQDYMKKIDRFDIADNIIDISKNVDMHMRPNHIQYEERYWNAVKNFVAYTVAYNFLSSGPLDVSAESKDLEGFKIYKQYDRDMKSGIHRNIREWLDFFTLIILSGGLDTPYISQTFAKGIFDPARPKTGRANIDLSDYYPWVNETTGGGIVTDSDGRQIELRGSRTISHRWRLGYYAGNYGSTGENLNSYAMFQSTGSWSERQETMY